MVGAEIYLIPQTKLFAVPVMKYWNTNRRRNIRKPTTGNFIAPHPLFSSQHVLRTMYTKL